MRLRRSRLRVWFKKSPRQRHLRGTWLHRVMGDSLFSAGLWKPSVNTVALGVGCGLFWAMMPIPFQMIPSAITAYFGRFNVPAAISVVWVTNPFTWPVILYWQYRLGSLLIAKDDSVAMSKESLIQMVEGVTGPLLLGCVISGLFFGVGGYFVVRFFWITVAGKWWKNLKQHRANL